MTARVSPTHALRVEIDALFTGDRDLVEALEDVARLGARLIIQTAVEAEVEAFLGRARYQRAATTTGDRGDAGRDPVPAVPAVPEQPLYTGETIIAAASRTSDPHVSHLHQTS